MDEHEAEPAPPSPVEALAAAVAEREQAAGVVLLRARTLRLARADDDAPLRTVAEALTRLEEADEEHEAAEQRVKALLAAMGPRELTEDERLRAATIARADHEDARAA